ncbi:MAG: formate--phosphoribosylaminoimidazolecarboxamide ligase [Thermoprotei archaeon]|nr:formate--phosphoribosylaminoimidazolecarboxamide ligase [Thermoprotei archaeon]
MRGADLIDIKRVLAGYDLDDLSIATLGSHSALQILHGAKKEGFRTIAIVEKRRKWFYEEFAHLIDQMIVVDSWRDVASKDVVLRLRESNAIFIPHGSFVEYIGLDRAESMEVPMFGIRSIFRIEADQRMKMDFLAKAGINIPREYRIGEEFRGPVIVKFPGAKGGRGYFIARTKDEVRRGIKKALEDGLISDEEEALIQEYVIGVPAYYHFFYSPMLKRLEILGADIRYESNADGLHRILPFVRGEIDVSFVVVGNVPLVLRESLLPKIMRYGLNFVRYSQERLPPGVIGPFCLESVIRDDGEIVVFEFSGRIVAGTNIYLTGSPYSHLYWDEPMSVGRRIAREIKLAQEEGKLDEVVT